MSDYWYRARSTRDQGKYGYFYDDKDVNIINDKLPLDYKYKCVGVSLEKLSFNFSEEFNDNDTIYEYYMKSGKEYISIKKGVHL